VHNGACANNSVHQSIGEDLEVQYVGIMDNPLRRAAEHLRQKGIDIDEIQELSNLSREDAHAVEQVLIEHFGLGKNGGSLLNPSRGLVMPQ
jgi:filamentous hemagglutinin